MGVWAFADIRHLWPAAASFRVPGVYPARLIPRREGNMRHAMERKKLNDIFGRTAKAPAAGRRVIIDTSAPGLWFRVTEKGMRSWLVRYRVKGQGETRGVVIGPYPVIRIAEARQRAFDIFAAARRGIDL